MRSFTFLASDAVGPSIDVRYAVAHFAKSQLWQASTILFGYFLTETCRLRPAEMGLIVGLSLFANGFVDLAVGYQYRTTRHTARQALHLQGRSATLICLFFVLFCTTAFVPLEMRFGWALVTLGGLRVTYPLLDVPQNALVSLIAVDDSRRGRLIMLRNMGSSIAGLAAAVIAMPLLLRGGASVAYLLWAIAAGGLLWVSSVLLSRAQPLADVSLTVLLSSSRRQPRFAMVLATLVMMMIPCTVFRTMQPYFGTFAAGGAAMAVSAAIASIVSQPLWLWLVRNRDVGGTLVVIAVTSSAAAFVLVGPIRASSIGAILAGGAFGAASSGLWLILWYLLAAHAGRGPAFWRTSVFTCISKLSQGAAMIWLGRLLDASRYRETLADPFSMPSLLMVAAVLAISSACIVLGIGLRFSRTASDGRSAMPRPSVLIAQARVSPARRS